MAQPAGDEDPTELYSIVNAIGSIYGDTNGSYANWLLQHAGNNYPADASFLWNQPFSDSGLVKLNATNGSSSETPSQSSKTNAAFVSARLTAGSLVTTLSTVVMAIVSAL